MRRWEIAGRLRAMYDRAEFRIVSNLREEAALRKAVTEATREDAADRAEVVALSLAVVDRQPALPHVF